MIVGYLIAKGINNQILNNFKGEWSFRLFPEPLIYMMITFAAAMGGSFILNQIKDIDSDKINKKLFLLGENCVPLKHAVIESAVLLLFSTILAYFINISAFLFIMLFTLFTGYLYNYQPFVFKNKPISGFLVNILMGWIAFTLGWIISRKIDFNFFLLSLPYLFLNTGLYLLTTIPDISGDRKVSKTTFAVKYGHKTAIRISILCYVLSAISSYFVGDYFMIIFFILGFYWIFHLLLYIFFNDSFYLFSYKILL
jgi:geranylgeranylglycerol-phosphate geranylgeranyltransferase